MFYFPAASLHARPAPFQFPAGLCFATPFTRSLPMTAIALAVEQAGGSDAVGRLDLAVYVADSGRPVGAPVISGSAKLGSPGLLRAVAPSPVEVAPGDYFAVASLWNPVMLTGLQAGDLAFAGKIGTLNPLQPAGALTMPIPLPTALTGAEPWAETPTNASARTPVLTPLVWIATA